MSIINWAINSREISGFSADTTLEKDKGLAEIATIVDDVGTFAQVIVFYNADKWRKFQELCNRAGNCWDRADPEVKEFIDIITNGKPQQDYYKLENIPRPD